MACPLPISLCGTPPCAMSRHVYCMLHSVSVGETGCTGRLQVENRDLAVGPVTYCCTLVYVCMYNVWREREREREREMCICARDV